MPDPITRREFAGLVAAGTVLSGSAEASAGEDKPTPAAKSPPVSPVDLLINLVREKYPHERLDEAAIEEIRSDFRHFQGRSKALSNFPLVNSDEPGFVFSAWRSERPAG